MGNLNPSLNIYAVLCNCKTFLYGQKLSKQNQMGQGFKRTFFCITSTFLDVAKKESKLSKDKTI